MAFSYAYLILKYIFSRYPFCHVKIVHFLSVRVIKYLYSFIYVVNFIMQDIQAYLAYKQTWSRNENVIGYSLQEFL